MSGEKVDLTTPGPWEAVCLGSEGYAIMGPPYEGRPGRRRVARCGDTDWEQDKANAQVIAAVPQMLDALATIHAIAAGGFAEGGTFGDLVSIESIARSVLREVKPEHFGSNAEVSE